MKIKRVCAGRYVVIGMNGDVDIYMKGKDSWRVSGEIVGEFFQSTVESFKEAKRIAIEATENGNIFLT